MPSLQRLKDALSGFGSHQADYQCSSCGIQFSSDASTVRRVSCPQCGSNNVRELL